MSRRIRITEFLESASVDPGPGLLSLPAEILDHILSYLTLTEWRCLRLVSTTCRDIIDHSGVWYRTCMILVKVPKTLSKMWQLLQVRNVSALDISEIDSHTSNTVQMKTILQSLPELPELRELRVLSVTVLFLNELKESGQFDKISRLHITDPWDYQSVNWCRYISSTLTNISRLTLHLFRGDVNMLLQQLACLTRLECLSVLSAPLDSQHVAVHVSLADMLYSLPKLTHLGLAGITLNSENDASPFDPRTCSEKLGISPGTELRLRKLHLGLMLTFERYSVNKRELLKESILDFLPDLQSLSYKINLRCGINRHHNVELNDINLDSGPTHPHPRLQELKVKFGPGITVPHGKCKEFMKRIPANVRVFSLGGSYFFNPSQALHLLSLTHGSTLTDLELCRLFSLNDKVLSFIAKTFTNLRILTCCLKDEVRASSIVELCQLPHFVRLEIIYYIPEIPEETLTRARDSLTRRFSIVRLTADDEHPWVNIDKYFDKCLYE